MDMFSSIDLDHLIMFSLAGFNNFMFFYFTQTDFNSIICIKFFFRNHFKKGETF